MQSKAVNTKEHRDDAPTDDSLLTKRELAGRLRLSLRTIDAWMRTKHLPYIKAGKTVRFRWEDVLEKLNAYRVN